MTCSFDELCTNTGRRVRGMCVPHYHRWRRQGGDGRVCSIEDCNRPLHAKGLCHTHHLRLFQGTPMDQPVRRYAPGATCDAPGCENVARSNGYCRKHELRWYRRGDVADRKREACGIPGCGKDVAARGWCGRHWELWHRYGDPLGGVGRWRTAEVVASIRADLRQATTMRAHDRRRDVAYLVERAGSHGQPLSKVEREVADALLMSPDRDRDNAQLRDDVMRLTAKGLGAKEIGRRLGVSDRTVVRYRAEAKKLESING